MVGVVILRFPSLFEPAWYRDEGITLVVGNAVRNGAVLYKDIADNKTPIFYFLASIFNSVFLLKMLLFVWMLFFAIAFYFLAKKLIGKTGGVIASLIVIFLLNTPLFEGNIANGEIFFILPNCLGMLLILGKGEKTNVRRYFLAGVLFGLGILLKQAAFFDFLTAFIFVLLFKERGARNIIFMLLGFICPVLLVLPYFALNNALSDFWKYAFLWNFEYSSYNNYFLVPYGNILWRLFLITGTLIILLKYQKNHLLNLILIIIWLVVGYFGSEISQRGYIHYKIPLLLPIALFLGYLYNKKKIVFIIAILTLLIFSLKLFAARFKFQSDYYQNYFAYIGGRKTRPEYRNFFDATTQRNYEIATYLTNHKARSIFVWGDEPFIYLLSGINPPVRFPVAYNINFTKSRKSETWLKIKESRPDHILVVEPVKFKFPELFIYIAYNYQKVATIEQVEIYERKIK